MRCEIQQLLRKRRGDEADMFGRRKPKIRLLTSAAAFPRGAFRAKEAARSTSLFRIAASDFLSALALVLLIWQSRFAALRLVLILGFLPASYAAEQGNAGTNTVLLFSFFRGNGEDGLHLAWSCDGLRWTELKSPTGKSFLEPRVGGRLMRDPCLHLGPDGTFRLVWTTSWRRPTAFGYASSKDLLEWSEPRAIPVLDNEPTAENVWAPELYYDAARAQWLIFWSTTIAGRFPETAGGGDHNHRIYFTTTKDFETFAPAKLFYDGGFNVIDATLLAANGTFYLIVKDETRNPLKKNLRIATADKPEGPFGPASQPISTNNWVEGPSAVQIGDQFYIYFDHYSKPQYYGAVKSTDLRHWQDISQQVSLPQGARHGTVLKVPETIINRIRTLPTHTTEEP